MGYAREGYGQGSHIPYIWDIHVRIIIRVHAFHEDRDVIYFIDTSTMYTPDIQYTCNIQQINECVVNL